MPSNLIRIPLTLCLTAAALTACGDDATTTPTPFPGFGDGSFGDGSLADGSFADGSSGDGSFGDGSFGDGSFGDGNFADGSFADGSSSDGSSGDGGSDGSSGDGSGDGAGDGGGDGVPDLPVGDPYDNDWTWVGVPGSKCRDGSEAGYYYREGSENKLMIFLNGGGACADSFFCNLNPKDVNHDLPIEFLSHGSPDLLFGVREQRQIAPEEGIFKRDNPANPVKDWNMVFVPYCTGDIHSGTRSDVEIPGVEGKQQFVGYHNYGKFLESFGPSFQNVEQILLTGSSAGGFGSLFNADRTQEYFKQYGEAKLITISDSGVPFRDEFMAACLQKRWRDYWGLNAILPQDCEECFNEDGGGLVEGYGKYLFHEKYGDRMLGGFVSSLEDEIIRAFFAPGLSGTAGEPDDCSLDPGFNTVWEAVFGGDRYTGTKFNNGLVDVIESVVTREKVGYYTVPATPHMHLWRARFYEKNGNTKTIAEWVGEILDEIPSKVGTLEKR